MSVQRASGCLLIRKNDRIGMSVSRSGRARRPPVEPALNATKASLLVKRRVCESCLYFESAGFAKNGWCHHPSRRQNSDVRLIVRSNELGCRNGWNADLWVAASVDDNEQRPQPQDSIASRAASEVEPAEPSDLITSIVAAKTENIRVSDRPGPDDEAPKPTIQEDIFVKQTPALSWNTGPISPQPATELVQNPKAAILRARDQFRERRRGEGRLADRSLSNPSAPLLASSREARLLAEQEPIELAPEADTFDPHYENRPLLRPAARSEYEDRRPISPVSLREMDRPFPSMTEFPEDRARFESVPHARQSNGAGDFSNQFDDDTWIETRQLDSSPTEPYLIDEIFEERDEVVRLQDHEPFEEVELSIRHRESMLDRYLRHRKERRQAPQYREESVYDSTDSWVSATHAETAASASAPSRTHVSKPVADDRRFGSFENDDELLLPSPLPAYPAESNLAYQTEPRSPAIKQREGDPRQQGRRPLPPVADEFGDQPLFAAQPVSPIEEDYEVQASYGRSSAVTFDQQQMERVCRTCRDFRPSETGERGWCNNKWAFNHRRMVDADDLACRNSLGSWWMPKDDIWRRDGDISRHAQQTPRVDQWLYGAPSDEPRGRRSGS